MDGAIARGRAILVVDEEVFAAARVRLPRDLLADLMVSMRIISNPMSVLNLHCNCCQNNVISAV